MTLFCTYGKIVRRDPLVWMGICLRAWDTRRLHLSISAKAGLPDWPEEAFAVRQLPDEIGPGNALMFEASFEHVIDIMTGFGRLGVSAESLAKTSAQRMSGYLATPAFAGPYLADQLLLPFAMAGGGVFTTVKPSQHTRTAAEIIALFTGRRTNLAQQPDGTHLASIS